MWSPERKRLRSNATPIAVHDSNLQTLKRKRELFASEYDSCKRRTLETNHEHIKDNFDSNYALHNVSYDTDMQVIQEEVVGSENQCMHDHNYMKLTAIETVCSPTNNNLEMVFNSVAENDNNNLNDSNLDVQEVILIDAE
jgi:hypothetical protein